MKPFVRVLVVYGGLLAAPLIVWACSSSSSSKDEGDGGETAPDSGPVVTRDGGKKSVSDAGGGGSSTKKDASLASAATLTDAGFVNGAIVTSGPFATMRLTDFADPDDLYLDYCISTDPVGPNTHWVGPVLRDTYGFLTVNDYDSLTQVSPYVNVAVGTQSLRPVLFDTADCNEGIQGLPDFSFTTPLAEGTRTTLALGGTAFDAGPRPLQLFQYTDIVVPAMGPNSVRVINMAQKVDALDVYLYSGFGNKLPCNLLYDDVAFGGVGVAMNVPGDGGPTAANGYTPLRGQNLYDLFFQSYTAAYAAHSDGNCNMPFGGLYSTDYAFSQGAWTMFIFDENYGQVLCRDDGTADPLCEHH